MRPDRSHRHGVPAGRIAIVLHELSVVVVLTSLARAIGVSSGWMDPDGAGAAAVEVAMFIDLANGMDQYFWYKLDVDCVSGLVLHRDWEMNSLTSCWTTLLGSFSVSRRTT